MIKKIYFENFKGFLKAEVQIENVTTLIGTNAAGKTNMIEGMMILSELMSGRDITAVLDGTKNSDSGIRGGAKGCCRFGSDYFILGCTVNYNEKTDLEYRIKVEVTDRVWVSEERLSEIYCGESKGMFYTKPVDGSSGDIKVAYNNGLRGTNPDITCLRFSAIISQLATSFLRKENMGRKLLSMPIL